MNVINTILSSVFEEIDAMRSGRFMPYHKISLMIALVTCLIFSVALSHQVVFNLNRRGKCKVTSGDRQDRSYDRPSQVPF